MYPIYRLLDFDVDGIYYGYTDSYCIYVVERGRIIEQYSYNSFRDFVYRLLILLTTETAFAEAAKHPCDGEDPRRQAFATQYDLLMKVDPYYAARFREDTMKLLKKYPFHDKR